MAAHSIVGEARHAVPHDRITGQRIIGAGQMTAEPRDLGSQTQNATASGFSSTSDLRRLWLTAEVMNAD